MRSILEELFYGNICPNTDCRSHDKETKQLMGYIADHHDNLLSTLNDQQKEILEKFDDCYSELTDINEREIFSYAFKLGMRIAIEVLTTNVYDSYTDYYFPEHNIRFIAINDCIDSDNGEDDFSAFRNVMKSSSPLSLSIQSLIAINRILCSGK